jgi:hypothetical protein
VAGGPGFCLPVPEKYAAALSLYMALNAMALNYQSDARSNFILSTAIYK